MCNNCFIFLLNTDSILFLEFDNLSSLSVFFSLCASFSTLYINESKVSRIKGYRSKITRNHILLFSHLFFLAFPLFHQSSSSWILFYVWICKCNEYCTLLSSVESWLSIYFVVLFSSVLCSVCVSISFYPSAHIHQIQNNKLITPLKKYITHNHSMVSCHP